MAYTDDAVKAKLSALNETQEAIVTVAQWIMFHKRYADQTAKIWAQRLAESNSPKKLNLIYLANEVVQQSKARKKNEFVAAFQPIIAEATATAYRGSSLDIQQKIRRVVDVWRQRQIFHANCQQDIEGRINEVDRSRGGSRKGGLGGSLFASSASSAPPEYQNLITTQASLVKLEALSHPAATGSLADWEKYNTSTTDPGTLAKQAGTLGGLLKTLANAEGAVAETLKARTSLIAGLEKILAVNKTALVTEEDQLRLINSHKVEIEIKKKNVEESIMASFASITNNGGGTPDHSPPRPDAEPLTPPPVESITPVGTPTLGKVGYVSTTGADVIAEQPPRPDGAEAAPPFHALPQESLVLTGPGIVHAAPYGSDSALPGLGGIMGRQASPMEAGAAKRRKMSTVEVGDEFAGFAEEGMGVDADVEAMLG